MRGGKRPGGVNGNLRRLVHRKAVDPGGNGRKRQAAYTLFHSQFQAGPITGSQQFPFPRTAPIPAGAGRVDDIPTGQPVSPGNLGTACSASVQHPALHQQFRPCRPMDRAVNASAAQQAGVGSVDNRLYAMVFCDITLYGLKSGNGIAVTQWMCLLSPPSQRDIPLPSPGADGPSAP